MDKIKVIHDAVGHTLTVWLDDPRIEHVCEETADEVILMKDGSGRVIGFELLHYRPAASSGLLGDALRRPDRPKIQPCTLRHRPESSSVIIFIAA